MEFARNRPPISSNHQVQQPIKTPSGFAPFIPPTSTTAAAAGFQSQLPGQGQQRLISGFPGVPQQQHPATPFGLPGPGIVGQERGPGGIMPSGVIEDHVLLRTGGLQQQALPISSSAGGGGVGQRKAPVTDQNLQEKVETILREWIKICYTPSAQREPQQALAVTVQMVFYN